MKIKRIDIFATHEAYKRPIPIAVGTHDSRDNVIIKIVGEYQGTEYEGWGEGSPLLPSYSGEVRDQMVDDIIKRIAPDILNEEINEVENILGLMDQVSCNKYYFMCALAAVDIALFDLLGKQKQEPVFNTIRKYLGFEPWDLDNMPDLPANFTVSRHDDGRDHGISAMIEEADEYLRQGYKTIKVKIGVNKGSDIESLRRLSDFIENKYPDRNIFLFADGNQAYGSVEEVLKIVDQIKTYIVALEQPFHRDIPELSRQLFRELNKIQDAPLLITDEGNSSIEETDNILLSDAAGGCLLKMVRSGGFHYVIKLMTFLKKYPNFKLGPCSMTETGIGTTANLHSALVVYDHCDPRLSFGFDGPMQVIGDSYRDGTDTIEYISSEQGWFRTNSDNDAIYDSLQIVGSGRGLGLSMNTSYIKLISEEQIQLTIHDDIIKKVHTTKNGSVESLVGSKKEFFAHPRY